MTIKGLVIAGYHHQYKDWLRRNKYSPHEYRYIADEHQLQGLQGIKLFYVGEYWRNPILSSDILAAYEFHNDAGVEHVHDQH